MTFVKITSKGQMTWPKEIRDELGFQAGSTVEVKIVNGQAVVSPTPSVEETLKKFASIQPKRRGGRKLMTQKDIDDAIAEGILARYRRSLK